MASQIPIKVMKDGSDNTCGLAQFTSSDSVAIAAGGTGLATQGICEFAQPGINAVACKTTYIGICAGKSEGVADENTYVGYGAGQNVTTGCYHTIIGSNAGDAITTCSGSVLIGYNAGTAITFGDFNTLIGTAAGAAVVTASNNTTVGYHAATATICSNNIAVGTCAMVANTQGQDNIAIGVKAGATQVAAGCNNVFIGSNAGAVSLCRDNISIGSYAGKAATTGGGNVMIGACVGYGVVGGASNVYIGDKAGLANTSGNDNVFIGKCAGCATTGSCCLIIGNATGTLIAGDFNSGVVEINSAYCLPAADGSASQFLCTDGSGALAFATLVSSPWSTSGSFITSPANCFVGIGTTTPNTLLHLETAAVGTAVLQIESTAANSYPYLRFKNDAVTWDVYGAHGGAGDAFQISGSAGGSFTFTGAGALGIGTSAALGTASQMRSITLGGTGFMMADCSCDAGDLFIMAQNAHYDTDCSWDYIVTDEATRYTQQNGTHVFGVAASGTAGAAVGFTDAVMINCLGNLGVASDGYAQADNNAILAKQTGTASGFRACFTNASYNGQGDYSTFSRAANSGYNMMVYQSNFDVSYDNEFVLRGDGNAYADGTWSDNGADYAEYFESTTGTALDQGKTVVLEGCQIRYYDATAGDTTEDIVGVVRPAGWSKNSMVIGNTAWNMHHDKYLTDDWGVYCLTDVPVKSWTDARGQEQAVYKRSPEWDTAPDNATITCQAERTLNPNYDESCTYISREDRPEWNIIGLLGQVQIATGQITRSNWIKMCDISDDVQLWLIR